MFKGYVINNTGRSRHIFKRTVYPGQKVPLDYVYNLFSSKVPEMDSFLEWLDNYIPEGWEIAVEKIKIIGEPQEMAQVSASTDEMSNHTYREDNEGLRSSREEEEELYLSKKVDKLTASEISNLKIKDNPRKVVKQIDSVHKLRRALTKCRNAPGKATLVKIIKQRINELNEAE